MRATTLTPDSLLQHESFVLRLARGLTRDEASALDLAQETLTVALDRPPVGVRSVRGWLATVLRNRAAERGRTESRRRYRETKAAPEELLELEPSAPLEQLELNQKVVEALLSLKEPYRGVVIGVYYEGASPAEVASRNGVGESTVRSQLSRAMEQLRYRLDGEYGDRQNWSIPMLAFWSAHPKGGGAATAAAGPTAAATGASAGAKGSALATGWGTGPAGPTLVGAAAVAAIAGLTLLLTSRDPEPEPALAFLGPAQGSSGSEPTDLAAQEEPVALASVRFPAAAPPVDPEPDSATWSSQEPEEILKRVQQVKTVILDRALAVPEGLKEKYAGDGKREQTGVIRILERSRFGADYSLPWMREGGSYYSFQRGLHDFNRDPDLVFEGGYLKPSGMDSVGLALGRTPVALVGPGEFRQPAGLDAVGELKWTLAWSEVPGDNTDRRWLENRQRELADEWVESGRLQPGVLEQLRGWGGASARGKPIVGESYVLRSRGGRGGDVLVAFEVVDVDSESCMLAWKNLKVWSKPNPKLGFQTTMHREELGPLPEALLAMSTEQLNLELDKALELAKERLFETFPPDIEERYGSLREEAGAGLVRLLPYLDKWGELQRGFSRGSAVSVFTGEHDDSFTYLGFQGNAEYGTLHPGLDGGAFGILVDLGEMELDEVVLPSLLARGDAAVDLALDYDLSELDGQPVDLENADAKRELIRHHQTIFRDRTRAVQRSDSPRAYLGHSYLARVVRYRDKDVLFAVRVVGLDDYGALVAWRVLESRQTGAPRR